MHFNVTCLFSPSDEYISNINENGTIKRGFIVNFFSIPETWYLLIYEIAALFTSVMSLESLKSECWQQQHNAGQIYSNFRVVTVVER